MTVTVIIFVLTPITNSNNRDVIAIPRSGSGNPELTTRNPIAGDVIARSEATKQSANLITKNDKEILHPYPKPVSQQASNISPN